MARSGCAPSAFTRHEAAGYFHGFTSEKKLDEALSQAHLAINLRYPTMGEAWSQLRIWAHASQSGSQVGWYATLPPDTVRFVRPDTNEVADIQKVCTRNC